MADRRMFTKKITESDAFLDMPASTQALYFHLNMHADDDGFVNSPKSIQRTVGASQDDLKLLLTKKFIIAFESGIIAIKHWKMHNYIQNDRYKRTDYIEEKNQLTLENNIYSLDVSKMDTDCIQDGYIGKERLGKERLGKDIILAQSKPAREPAIGIPINTGEDFPIYEEEVTEYQQLYPNVDVMAELRKMRAWCLSNPKRKKTSKGVKRFINSWLSKEQDNPKQQNRISEVDSWQI